MFVHEDASARGKRTCVKQGRRYNIPRLQYGTLQFSKYDEIEKKGYRAAVEILDRWEDEGKLPSLTIDGPNTEKNKAARKGRSARRNSV